MNNLIIDPLAPEHKPTDSADPDAFICPACYGAAHFSSADARVWCSCGWAVALTDRQVEELVDTLLGMTNSPVHVPTFLKNLHVTDGGGDDPPPTPARAYTYRNDAVAAEVAALPPPDASGFVARALAAQHPETAATAIRGLVARGDLAAAQAVAAHLLTLIAVPLRAIARRHFPDTADSRAELCQALTVQLWADLCDLRPTQDFLTYNLICVLNRTAASVAARMRRPWQGEVSLVLPDAADEALVEAPWLAAPFVALDAGLAAREILSVLTPQERQVISLLAQGIPVSSKDPAEVTISRILGVTDRTVRNIRRRAAARVAAAGLVNPAAALRGALARGWAWLARQLTGPWSLVPSHSCEVAV